jgi:LAS superfamily LD-carboxypeptidase LdcB
MLNELELTGRACTHVVQRDDLGAALHHEALQAFLAMKGAAEADGVEIRIVSSFRDFAAQQRIWDEKYLGERPLYDAHGNTRNHGALDPDQLIDAIVCWSAVPGGSRHHWGTDIDVIDSAAMPEGYRVRLLPDEAEPGGVFDRLHRWLAGNMSRYGFFRPYGTFRGGVHPEPWHLSYAPVATRALEALTLAAFEGAVRASSILGKDRVLARSGEIYRRYIANVDGPDSSSRRTLA